MNYTRVWHNSISIEMEIKKILFQFFTKNCILDFLILKWKFSANISLKRSMHRLFSYFILSFPFYVDVIVSNRDTVCIHMKNGPFEKSVFMRITHICNGNLKWMPQFVAIYLHFCVVEKFPERYNLTTTRRWYCNKSSTIQNNCRAIEDKMMCMCSCTLNVCVCEGLRFSVYQYRIRPMAKYIHNRDR